MSKFSYCIAVALLVLPVLAQAKLGAPSQSSVEFVALGPAGLKIVGKSSALAVRDEETVYVAGLPAGSFSTGIALRDNHMRKALEADKHPNIEVLLPKTGVKLPATGETSGDVEGTVKLHGVSKPAKVHYTAKAEGGSVKIHSTLRVNVKDFGIEPPSYLGVTVKPEVDLTVDFTSPNNG